MRWQRRRGRKIITVNERTVITVALQLSKVKNIRMEWISVKDKMPEEDIEIIMFSPELDEVCIGHYTGQGFTTSASIKWHIHVSHWMYKPERPV